MVVFAFSGSTDYLAARGEGTPLNPYAWLGWDESLADLDLARWMRENLPAAHVVARFDSVLITYHAARVGLGIAFLPFALADRDATLRRVDRELLVRCGSMWLLTHPDLRRTARVRRFIEFMGEATAATRDAREGRLPFVASVGRRPRGKAGGLPRARFDAERSARSRRPSTSR